MPQYETAQIIGLPDNVVLSSGTLAVNAATTRLMFTFIIPKNKTLNKVKIFLTAVGGTLGANDMVCALWSMPTGAVANSTGPSASIESSNTVTTTPTGSQWVEFTGFTTALTGGTQYALVITNANGTPGTNNFTVRWVIGSPNLVIGATANGWAKRTSTDDGVSWTASVLSVGGFRLEFSDGSFEGIPASQGAVVPVAQGVYAAREAGVKFTTPADAKIRIHGIAARIAVTGTPTGQPQFKLYKDTTIVDTTAAIPQYTTAGYLTGYFAAPIALDANSVYRIMLGETAQADTSGNRFNLYEFTIENDANSKAIMPFGSWVKTYFNAGWADTNTSSPVMWMIGDTTDLFDVVPVTTASSSIG